VSGTAESLRPRAAAPTTPARTDGPLLRIEKLVKHFQIKSGFFGRGRGAVKAVDDLSFTVAPGETLALVGESGCGKSTTGRLLLRLIEASSGAVYFQGRNIFELGGKEMRRLRRAMQIVFQGQHCRAWPWRAAVELSLTSPPMNGLAI
jgi:oligopeptide transport system ATP-binding protein